MAQLETPPARTRPKGGGRRWLPIVIGIIAVVAIGIGAWVGISGYETNQHDKQVAAADATAGQNALKDGLSDINVMNTVDYTNVDADMRNWLNATTGTLRGQLAPSVGALKLQFIANQVRVTGKITSSRVLAADAAGGTALIGGTEDVTRSQGTATAQILHEIFTANLRQTPSGWKITAYTTQQAQH